MTTIPNKSLFEYTYLVEIFGRVGQHNMEASFHFTQDSVDEQLFTDVQKINNFPVELLSELVTILLNVMQGTQDLTSSIGEFCAKHSINEARLRPTVKALVYLFRGSMRNNATPKHIGEDLLTFGIEKEQAIVVAQAWKSNLLDLSRSVIGQTLQVNEVLDMEWKFGVTAATNDLRHCGNSYLQLRLVLDKGNGRTQTVTMELTLPQFYDFMKEMERAKSSLDYFG